MIIRRRVILPYPSFLTAWLALDLGELPSALLPATHIPRATAEQAWEDLFERDLALGHTLDELFAGTLRVLNRAATRYYAFFHEGDRDTCSVLVAGRVIAEVDGNTITLRPARTNDGARALVDALPHRPKTPGEPLSAPADSPTDRMRWLLSQTRTGGGQIYVARRDRTCDQPISYFDSKVGRFIATEDMCGWRSLIPADAATLRKRISEMMSDVTAGREPRRRTVR